MGNPNWVPGKSGNAATQWRPGQSGNNGGMRHAIKCQKLIETHKLDEEIALMASRQGKYKRVPYRDQISAYELLRDNAYGKPAVIQIANFNEVQFVKRLIGVADDSI
jgi:hypothetical protein